MQRTMYRAVYQPKASYLGLRSRTFIANDDADALAQAESWAQKDEVLLVLKIVRPMTTQLKLIPPPGAVIA